MFYANGALFVHVPKCGGTSLTRYLLDCAGMPGMPTPGEMKHYTLGQWRHTFPGVPLDRVMMLVRNPYERMVSVYFWHRRVFNQNLYGLGDSLRAIGAASLTFPDWLRWTQTAAVQSDDWKPAELFVEENGEVPPCVTVLRMEDLETEADSIAAFFGLSERAPLQRLLATDHPDFRQFYTEETAGIVYRAHRWAFERGGYDPDGWQYPKKEDALPTERPNEIRQFFEFGEDEKSVDPVCAPETENQDEPEQSSDESQCSPPSRNQSD